MKSFTKKHELAMTISQGYSDESFGVIDYYCIIE